MKNKLLIIAIIIFSSTLFSKSIDVVHLNNGGIIKGEIIEMIPNDSVKIKTSDGSIFVYNMDEVTKIENEELHQSSYEEIQEQQNNNTKKVYRKILFRSLITIGFIVLLQSLNAA